MVLDGSFNLGSFNTSDYYSNTSTNNRLLSNDFCNSFSIKRTGIKKMNFIKNKKTTLKRKQIQQKIN